VAEPRLHLDADASIKAQVNTLRERGHDVTRTPNDWMPADASDREQLLGDTAQGRVIFTFNVRDFLVLAKKHPKHAGILLATQSRWSLAGLIAAIDRAFSETGEDNWRGKVLLLGDFSQ
jgi:hypothetical protein